MKKSILAVGVFPPPISGAALNLLLFTDYLSVNHVVEKFNISGQMLAHKRSFLGHLQKVTNFIFCACKLIFCYQRNNHKLYIVPDGGYGQIYTIIFLLIARFKNWDIFIHHHGYAYINEKRRLASAMTHISRESYHIFLDFYMAIDYMNVYGKLNHVLLCLNTIHISVDRNQKFAPIMIDDESPIRLGHLSNLCIDKGLQELFDLCRLLKNKGINFEITLAGKPVDQAAINIMNEMSDSLGASYSWIGEVVGDRKERFYSNLDVFLFPTKYAQEAQPNVIFEAMSKGVPVIAYERGCIARMVVNGSGLVIPRDRDFKIDATKWLCKFSKSKEFRIEQRELTLLEICRQKKIGQNQLDIIFNLMQ